MDENFTPLLNNDARSAWLRLHTLAALRWMAMAGQTVAVLLAGPVLGVQIRLDLCLAVIASLAVFNIIQMLVSPRNKRLKPRDAMLALLFDLVQLGLLLALTGGLTNPFALLVLAPVTIAATALTLRATVVVALSAMAIIMLVSQFYEPLHLSDGAVLEPPPLITFGTLAALLIGIFFISVYARRVTVESVLMSQALAATQMALAREQRLTALGGVVAAAAHELGTPLATIKLVSSELLDELDGQEVLREDVELIRDQAVRCSEILRDMGRSGKDDALLRHAPLSALLEEAADPHQNRGARIIMRYDGAQLDEAVDTLPVVSRQPELVHGLRNLVQNAVDFASSTVWVDANWTADELRVAVGDDGPGFPPDLLGRIGDPFLSRRDHPPGQRPNYEGMGLGLFIAKTLLERTGARLTFTNASERPAAMAKGGTGLAADLSRATGALVEVVWPRAMLEPGRDVLRGPLGENPRNPG